MCPEIPKIGRGKNMSIAKAGLIVWYEMQDEEINYDSFDRGIPDIMHKIVDVAGAKSATFFTSNQVMKCLANSPYWDKRLVYGMYKGIGGAGGSGDAVQVEPSQKGFEYYEKYLKNRTQKSGGTK